MRGRLSPVEWEVLARRLYEEDVAGTVGATAWEDLGESRWRWFALAEGVERARRRYEDAWGDLPHATPWDALRPSERHAWIVEALRNPGRVA